MPHVGHADSVMNDERGSRSNISNRSSSNPVTRVIKVTLPTPTISLYDHSFICCHSYIHTHIHTFIHARIHSFIPCIQSIAYAVDASQRFMLRHEAVVASFDMSDDRPGFEGRPAKGSRPPRVKQSQGKNRDDPQWPCPIPLRSG